MMKIKEIIKLLEAVLAMAAIIIVICNREWLAYVNCDNNCSLNRCIRFVDKYPDSYYCRYVQELVVDYEDEFVEQHLYLNVPYETIPKGVKNNIPKEVSRYFCLFPKGKHSNEVYDLQKRYQRENSMMQKEVLQDEREEDSLPNGSQPYSQFYGINKNYSKYDDRSGIEVVASNTEDVVVIIKHNNGDGPVIAHMYVRKGMAFSVELAPNATYQVFFYSGNGWDPQKRKGKIQGGFIKNENLQKDKPIYLENLVEMQYTLQESTAGNLSLSRTTPDDAF